MKTDISSNTIIAKNIIKDHKLSNDLAPHIIIISPVVSKSFRSPRQEHYTHLEEEQKNKVECEMEMKARLITDDIDKIKLQQKDLSGVITMMETESNDSMHLAEKNEYLSYVIKSDALKRKSEPTKKELATLQKEIGELEM